VDDILVSAAVNAKINQKHGLSASDVELAVAARVSSRTSPNQHGVPRLLLVGVVRGRRVNVVLYPTGTPGTWRLATAFPER
jgi:uncharacterized DUF497 family protein